MTSHFSIDHPTEEHGKFSYFVCSKEHPMPKDKPFGSRWIHKDAEGTQRDYTEVFECPHCHHQWEVELPE